ncbi:MAG: molybdopterin-dependent oxidoreductase [Vicinamibacterales bacterium]|nr:molybdopterin-dependent oxidoreductase [Vicinamibacterales bacterium]
MTQSSILQSSIFIVLGAVLFAQQAPSVAATMTIAGDVAKPQTLSVAELKAMPRTSMKVTDEKGRAAAYDGVLVAEILRRAGATMGPALKGTALSAYVVVTARDAYQVVFSLAELDPAVGANDVLLADTLDGHPIPDAQGPLRIVVPREKENSRWVRQVEKIDVVQLRK